MFWFRHVTAARNDAKIKLLRQKMGHAGYAIYMMVLEIVAENTKGDDFSLTQSLSSWATELGTRADHVVRFLASCRDADAMVPGSSPLLDSIMSGTMLTISVPKLKKYRDEYSRRNKRVSGETTGVRCPTGRGKSIQVKKETTKEKAVVEKPSEKPSEKESWDDRTFLFPDLCEKAIRKAKNTDKDAREGLHMIQQLAQGYPPAFESALISFLTLAGSPNLTCLTRMVQEELVKAASKTPASTPTPKPGDDDRHYDSDQRELRTWKREIPEMKTEDEVVDFILDRVRRFRGYPIAGKTTRQDPFYKEMIAKYGQKVREKGQKQDEEAKKQG